MQLTHRLPWRPALTQSMLRAARRTRWLGGAAPRGTGSVAADFDAAPPEPFLWAEMAPDLELRRIARQAEARHTAALATFSMVTAATKGRP